MLTHLKISRLIQNCLFSKHLLLRDVEMINAFANCVGGINKFRPQKDEIRSGPHVQKSHFKIFKIFECQLLWKISVAFYATSSNEEGPQIEKDSGQKYLYISLSIFLLLREAKLLNQNFHSPSFFCTLYLPIVIQMWHKNWLICNCRGYGTNKRSQADLQTSFPVVRDES